MASEQKKYLIQRRAGLSLIEVLSVVAIIGIILGFAIPAWSGIQRQIKRNTMHVQLVAYAQALEHYYQVYQAFPSFLTPGQPVHVQEHWESWTQMLTGCHTNGQLITESRWSLNPSRIAFLPIPARGFSCDWDIQVVVCPDANTWVQPSVFGPTTPAKAYVYTLQSSGPNHENVASWQHP